VPVHDERSLGPELREHARHLVRHAGIAHAQHLPAHARRIRERPEEVEHRRHAQLPAGGNGMPHRRVETRREAEADPGLVHAAGNCGGLEIDGDAERLEEISAPARRRGGAIAVLAHLHAGPGDDERRDRGHVDRMTAVTARAAGVDYASHVLQGHRLGGSVHGLQEPDDLVDGLALHPEGDDERRDLGGGGVSGEYLAHGRRRVLGGDVKARGQRAQHRGPAAERFEVRRSGR
jgi:hypothetical protein